MVDHLNHDELWPSRIFIYEMHQLLLQRQGVLLLCLKGQIAATMGRCDMEFDVLAQEQPLRSRISLQRYSRRGGPLV